MTEENPGWGYLLIMGELDKLGIKVSKTLHDCPECDSMVTRAHSATDSGDRAFGRRL